MEIAIARQPIFNRNLEVVAYELLYRNYGATDIQNLEMTSAGDHATSSVIIDALTTMGL